MSDINSLNKNNTSYVLSALNYIVICDTNANVVAKTASAPDAFNLDSNLCFKIKFTKGNTANSPTLNLNSTGAKAIVATTSSVNFVANELYDCYYNGTQYVIDNTIDIKVNNTTTINGHALNGNVTVSASDVGLGNVVNTGDSATPTNGGTTKFTTGGAYTELAKKVNTSRTINGHALTSDVSITKSDVGLGSITNAPMDTTSSTTSTNYLQNKVITAISNGAVCDTASGTAEKTININGFTLFTGATIRVLFSNTCTVSNPTLNVNGTGAKSIVSSINGTFSLIKSHTGYWGESATSSSRIWDANTTLELMYDGTYWVIMGNPIVNSYYGNDKGYIIYANGFMKQWGINSASDTSTNHYSFLITFPTIWFGCASDRQGWGNGNISYVDNTTYSISAYANGFVSDNVHWSVIGY